MNISLINIGDELLIGQVVNTNASTMSQRLTSAGMEVQRVVIIPDNGDTIRQTLIDELHRSDAVLVTGGLGPTKDDITKSTIADLFHSTLVESPVALATIRSIFERRHYELTPLNRQQALVPDCCTVIDNQVGTAPCMWFEGETINRALHLPADTRKVLVSMPGVPYEMEWLMEHDVVARLRHYFHTSHIISKNIVVQGIGESFLSDLVEPWELSLPAHLRLAYLPQAGMVKLRLTARGENADTLRHDIQNAVDGLYALAGKYIVGEDCESIPEVVASIFRRRRLTLATAESCTGGFVASRLTALAGCSEYYMGGVVSYSNDVKENTLGVNHDTLLTHGAVSEETARQMAEGVRTRLHADFGTATTGIAGPGGGTPDKPVGTVWIAVAGPQRTVTQLLQLGDDRQRTIERTTNALLSLLVKEATM